jgi:hypothetical protein
MIPKYDSFFTAYLLDGILCGALRITDVSSLKTIQELA